MRNFLLIMNEEDFENEELSGQRSGDEAENRPNDPVQEGVELMLKGAEKMPIPLVFQDTIEEKPFEHCIKCGSNLIQENLAYVVEKSVMQHDVKFEYAMCMNCMGEMRRSMSGESMERMNHFMESNINPFERSKQVFDIMLKPGGSKRPEELMSSCIISGDSVTQLTEYHIIGLFKGDKMMVSHMPYMISMQVLEELQELLSPETRGEWDDFVDNFLGIPPEWRKLLKEEFVLV